MPSRAELSSPRVALLHGQFADAAFVEAGIDAYSVLKIYIAFLSGLQLKPRFRFAKVNFKLSIIIRQRVRSNHTAKTTITLTSEKNSQFQPMAQKDEIQKSGNFQKLLEWNREVPQAVETLVHRLIQAQSLQQPELQAVCSWDGNLTYAELDSLSSRLASYLSTQSVGPEVIVPLCFEKSVWTVVSLLAVLKAGGTFLLLDISQPIVRLESIVRQTGATFALSSAAFLDTIEVLVDEAFAVDAAAFLKLESSLSFWPAKLNNAAYVVFTSGSTGTPKGVVIEHLQLSTMCAYAGERLGCESAPRVFQFSSYAFDACISDIIPTLVYGGTVCIPSDWERKNAIVDAMRRMDITVAKLTPSLVSTLTLEKVPTLSTLGIGGERIPPSLVKKWAPKLRLFLGYGPAECCVVCFIADASRHKVGPGEIGRPVGARAWIVKQGNYNELAEIGETGELLIEGPLLARGYLNDPVKTDRLFVRNPAWMSLFPNSQKECRLYRTGDLARHLEDGRVCYMGRIDNQVKIRGQRLELEEVEKRLLDCLAQLECVESKHVVVEAVKLSGSSTTQLVAFLLLRTPRSLGSLDWEGENGPILQTSALEQEQFSAIVSRIEAMLKLVSPSYAVPSVWIPLRSLPFSVSQKVDRKRLRTILTPLSVKHLSTFANPRVSTASKRKRAQLTANELKLQALWADVFGACASTIEPDDNFFHFGGDSLLAMRLVSMARREGLTLSMNAVFGSSTLRDMALTFQENVSTTDLAPFALLQGMDVADLRRQTARQCGTGADKIEDIYPLSAMQLHYVTGYPEDKRKPSDRWHWQLQTVYNLPQHIDLERFRALWNSAIRRHPILRTRIVNTSSGVFQAVLKDSMSPSWKEENDLEQYMERDKSDNMAFGDCLVRLAVVKSHYTGERFFVLTIQHLIYDGFSNGILCKELDTAYFHGFPNMPLPKMNQYIKYITEADKVAATGFWTSYLGDAVTKPLLATVDEGTTINESWKTMAMDIPRRYGSACTLPTMIEVASGLAIAQQLGCPDVIFNSDRSGRNLPVEGIQDLVGPTTLFLPLRIHLDAEQKVQDLLRQSQNFQRATIPFEHLGWLELREMGHLKAILQQKLNLNINPNSVASLWKGVGLELKSSHETIDDPFGINVSFHDGKLKWSVYYDERFITGERVESLLEGIRRVLLRLVEAYLQPELTVGEILERLGNGVLEY
jgi:amino acid adenylation domain-containing protein